MRITKENNEKDFFHKKKFKLKNKLSYIQFRDVCYQLFYLYSNKKTFDYYLLDLDF